MFIKTKITLAAALVLSAAVAASAATTKYKNAIRQIVLSAHHAVPSAPSDHPDSDDPVAAGGGSLGYNQALHYWW